MPDAPEPKMYASHGGGNYKASLDVERPTYGGYCLLRPYSPFTPSREVSTIREPKRKGFYLMARKKAQSEIPPRILFLKVIYLPEGNAWVAQCLEHDIAAQGKTLPEAEDAFRRTLLAQVVLDIRKGREPLEDIKAAPKMYWRKWDEGIR